jgi:urate oxidase
LHKQKADLETLNSDIDTEIEKNKSVISTLTSKNTELASLKSNNESSIKTFAKFLKQ